MLTILDPEQPLAERMTQPSDGSIQPIKITEKEQNVMKENDHHGTGSKLMLMIIIIVELLLIVGAGQKRSAMRWVCLASH